MPIFRVKSVKIYTGQKKFTQAPPVAPVTNMRYGSGDLETNEISYFLFGNILNFNFVWLFVVHGEYQ